MNNDYWFTILCMVPLLIASLVILGITGAFASIANAALWM